MKWFTWVDDRPSFDDPPGTVRGAGLDKFLGQLRTVQGAPNPFVEAQKKRLLEETHTE
jgi:hypothetical protein